MNGIFSVRRPVPNTTTTILATSVVLKAYFLLMEIVNVPMCFSQGQKDKMLIHSAWIKAFRI